MLSPFMAKQSMSDAEDMDALGSTIRFDVRRRIG